MRRLVLLLVAVAPSCADEPPSYEEFEVISADKAHVAQVKRDPASAGKERWDADWVLRVFAAKDGKAAGAALWSVPYRHSGYSGGLLTDGGLYFVCREVWYRHFGPVVSVYSADRKAPSVLLGADFHVDRASLGKTASHFLWLPDEQPAGTFADGGRVWLIQTRDLRSHAVDLATGALTGRRVGAFRVSLAADVRVLRLGEPLKYSLAITNVSGDAAAIAAGEGWNAAVIALADSAGQEVPLSAEGKARRERVDPKSLRWVDLAAGERRELPAADDLLNRFEISKPGAYSLVVSFEEMEHIRPFAAASNPLVLVVVADAFPTPQDLADWTATALERGNEERLGRIIPEKHRPRDWFKAMVEGHRRMDYRFRSEILIGREWEAHVLIEPVDMVAPTISCVRMEGGWVVEEVTVPK